LEPLAGAFETLRRATAFFVAALVDFRGIGSVRLE
jgi:hypothetical protein